MLYTYKQIAHDFTKMHCFIEHLVLKVWCTPTGPYSINKLHPDFIPIVNGVNTKYLKNPIKKIYGICIGLSDSERRILKQGFKENNAIESLCNGNGTPLLYSRIQNFSPQLKIELDKFFKNLYSKVLLLKPFKDVCGDIDDYYDKVVGGNEKCAFCGICEILTPLHSKRDALDHYLPKDTYPFNSVNPNNLAPICKTCNTSYKTTHSPIKKDNGRKRKAFFPFAKKSIKLNIQAKFSSVSILKMKPSEVKLEITNRYYGEQIETWMDLFGIEERYRIKMCSEDARDWLNQMKFEFDLNPKTKNKTFDQRLKYFEQNLLANNNFLKIPYLQACRDLGVLK